MASKSKIVTRICTFILFRSPFIYALLFILILGEKGKVKSEPPISYTLVYTHIGILIITGLGMMLRLFLTEVSIIHAGHLAWFAYKVYNTANFGYLQWLRLRIASHCIGIIGVYLLYGALSQKNPSKSLIKMSYSFFGIYLTASAYIMNNSLDDRWAFFSRIFHSYYALYAVIGVMFICSLSFFSGKYCHIAARVAAIIILTHTILIDFDFTYWTKDRHQEYWITARLFTDNIYILCALILISLNFSRHLYVA